MISTLGYFLMELCMPWQLTARPSEAPLAAWAMVAGQAPVLCHLPGETGTGAGEGQGCCFCRARNNKTPFPDSTSLPVSITTGFV